MSVSGKAQVGKFYERIGDDYLTVNVTSDKTVLEIEQWDAIGRRMNSVNFFTSSAPQLVSLIQKAAGIKADPAKVPHTGTPPQGEEEMTHAKAAGWHCMACGRGSFGGPCVSPEPQEDPYEYAVQRTSLNNDKLYIVGNFWSDKEDREAVYKGLSDSRLPVTYKLVKRRKAGGIEDA